MIRPRSNLKDKYALTIIYLAVPMIQSERELKIINDLGLKTRKIFLGTAQENDFKGVKYLNEVANRMFETEVE